MTFLEFIKQQLKHSHDKNINEFISWIKKEKNCPDTSDIKVLSKYLYNKLDRSQTLAYQKSLMMYFYTLNNFKMPKEDKLPEINYVIELQNADPQYMPEQSEEKLSPKEEKAIVKDIIDPALKTLKKIKSLDEIDEQLEFSMMAFSVSILLMIQDEGGEKQVRKTIQQMTEAILDNYKKNPS